MYSRKILSRSILLARTDRSLRGFTLIELLIVISIMLIIAVMTATAIKLTISGDKVRSGARQVQSYLAGARDRAIYSKAQRGVRFLLDSSDPTMPSRTVTSMVFVGPTDPWSQGAIQMERLDLNLDGFVDVPGSLAVVVGDPYNQSGWQNLYAQGLIPNGTRIKIPNEDTGQWYTVTTDLLLTSPYPRLRLSTIYQGSGQANPSGTAIAAFGEGSGPTTYQLELPPTVLPNQEVVLLPKGVVIHLDRCSNNFEQSAAGVNASGRANKLPDYWKNAPSSTGDPSGFDYLSRMDVMFSPRGVVVGTAAQRGIIHLYIADQKDADRDRLYWSSPTAYPTSSAAEYGAWTAANLPSDTNNINIGYERNDKIILSLFTRTGAVSTHHVFSNADPFRYAETGEVAGK